MVFGRDMLGRLKICSKVDSEDVKGIEPIVDFAEAIGIVARGWWLGKCSGWHFGGDKLKN